MPLRLTLPPTALPSEIIVSDCPLSLAAPFESFASRLAKLIERVPESSATLLTLSFVPSGGSFTSVTVTFTVPAAVFGSGWPAVVPLSVTV